MSPSRLSSRPVSSAAVLPNMNASNEDAESVEAFLERIASLKEKREREDQDPTQKLEEDILQGRRERRAKRAERIRSLSPTKTSQPSTSTSSVNHSPYQPSPEHAINPPINMSPFSRPQPTHFFEAMSPPSRNETPRPLPAHPSKPPTLQATNATALSRSGTLSWQQRPSSKDSNTSPSRPVSQHRDETASEAPDMANGEHSRDQIALTLSSKDPSWFRQTTDRGASSSAYRKSRPQSIASMDKISHPLPGMSQKTSVGPGRVTYPSTSRDRSTSPAQARSALENSRPGNTLSSKTPQSTIEGPDSVLPTRGSLRLSPPAEGHDTEPPAAKGKTLSSLPSQLPRDRPPSPTKGLGGFVQSAMMKRSDSVSKRWSAQAAPGLSRGNSVATYRGGHGYSSSITSGPASPPRDPNRASKGLTSSPSAKSRPTSSHSTSAFLSHPEPANPSSPSPISSNEGISVSSPADLTEGTPLFEMGSKEHPGERKRPISQSIGSLPVSPTKTMDPKRWSPTKASWLESALARPESPKFTSPKPQTPTWMAELQKSKLSQDDTEPDKGHTSHLNSVGQTGLMKSPQPGDYAQPPGGSKLPEDLKSGMTRKISPERPANVTVKESRPPHPQIITKHEEPSTLPTSRTPNPESPAVNCGSGDMETWSPKPAIALDGKKQSPPTKPKPQTSPNMGLRANLKPRQNISAESSSTEPEFKNVFGKLKRTQTRNYVAPDLLRNNILKGKAALNLTGGPQKAGRVDEFKESILRKKESMKAGAELSKRSEIQNGRAEAAPRGTKTIPEALAKRNALNKCTKPTNASPAKPESGSPSGIPRSVPLKGSHRGVTPSEDQLGASHKSTRTAESPGGVVLDPTPSKSYQPVTQNIEGQAMQNDVGENGVTLKQACASSLESLNRPPTTAVESAEERRSQTSAGRLAGRLNPGLAGVISRGPTSTGSSRNISGDDIASTTPIRLRSSIEEAQHSPAGQLTHMTKARARGPKRRLPEATGTSDQANDVEPRLDQAEIIGGAHPER